MFLHYLHFKGLLILSKCPWSTLLISDPVHLTTSSLLLWCVLISALHFKYDGETMCTAVTHFYGYMYGCFTFLWVKIINICLVFSTSEYFPLHLQKVSLFRVWPVFFLSMKGSYPVSYQYWLHNLSSSCISVFSVLIATYLTFSFQDVQKL